MSYLEEIMPIKIKVIPRPTQIPSTKFGNNPNVVEMVLCFLICYEHRLCAEYCIYLLYAFLFLHAYGLFINYGWTEYNYYGYQYKG